MSVSNVGGPRVQNNSLFINEADLQKNHKLIESTVNQALNDINKAWTALKNLEQNLFSAGTQGHQHGITAGPGGCFPTEPPKPTTPPADPFAEPNKLKVDSATGKITTPGGYTIEQLGQFEWKISGPDGKSTRVWGDPHVDESDGGKFDFKKNTTFALPDGTEIHVTTKPWGNGGMTVTGQLDITNGADHIRVSDIDKGKGKVGEITKDGYETKVNFRLAADPNWKSENYLHMGKETDDWAYLGKEVIGDVGGGDSFKLGKDLEWGTMPSVLSPIKEEKKDNNTSTTNKPTRQDITKARNDLFGKLFEGISKLFEGLKHTRCHGFNPFRGGCDFGRYDRHQHRDGIQHAFRAVQHMFRALDEINKLNDMVRPRNIFF